VRLRVIVLSLSFRVLLVIAPPCPDGFG